MGAKIQPTTVAAPAARFQQDERAADCTPHGNQLAATNPRQDGRPQGLTCSAERLRRRRKPHGPRVPADGWAVRIS